MSKRSSFAVVDKGLQEEEQSCILVLDGKFYGMGYLPSDIQLTNSETVKDFLTPYKENYCIHNLLMSYKSTNPAKIIELDSLT